MPATKKKTIVKKTYMTVGKLFDKMAEKATFLDYRILGPDEMENPPFVGFEQIGESVLFYEDRTVGLHDVGTWPRSQRVNLKGRTATFDHGNGYTIQIRFYSIKPINLT